jgi:deoxyguanosine kinase
VDKLASLLNRGMLNHPALPAQNRTITRWTMYIAIEGVIGVGKTTLARKLQERFDAELQLEVFEENPFLADFYGDRARYAFQTQIFFLLSRYHQQRREIPEILKLGRNLLSDYTFAKDSLFARINLEGDELEIYYQVHEALAEKIALPDLVVYLRADTNILMQRIAMRDRSYERNMDVGYIEELNQSYNAFFSEFNLGPKLLVVDSNRLDFVAYPDHLQVIEDRIRQSLAMPPYQSELPLGSVSD